MESLGDIESRLDSLVCLVQEMIDIKSCDTTNVENDSDI